MRNSLIICILFLSSVSIARAQCNEYYQFGAASEWEMASYNAKDKLTGKNKQKVISLDKTSNGFNAVVSSEMYDDKGKEMMKGELEFKCVDGTMYIDMRNFIPEEQLKAFGSYEIQVESENLEMPSSLSIGKTLKDGWITVTAIGAPFTMKMHVKITDRKVVAQESLTTPAGTFNCHKITSTLNFENQMGVKMNFTMSSIDWIATKVGTVRSESYNKNGKLGGYSILTSWK